MVDFELAGWFLRIQEVPLDHIQAPQIQALGIDFGKILDPKIFLNPLQEAAKQLIVVSRSVAFVTLVWSMISRMSGQPEHKEFWAIIYCRIALTAVMMLGNQLIYLVDDEVNKILAMPIHVTTSDGVQITDSLGATPDMITERWSKIFGEVQNPVPQNNGALGMIPGANVIAGAWNEAKNTVWNVIHAIWRGIQVAVMVFFSGLYLLQRILLIAGGVYYPIAIGQMGSRTLRNTGLNFLLSYLGLFCWPIGWGIVNLGVLAAIAMSPARTNVTSEDLLRSLVAGFPIMFWIVLGYVLAPFCIQKIVAKGGAAIQPFLSTSIMGSVAGGIMALGYFGDRLMGGLTGAGRALGGGGSQRSNAANGQSGLLPWVGNGGSGNGMSYDTGQPVTQSGVTQGSGGGLAGGRVGGTQGTNGTGGRFGGFATSLSSLAYTIGDLSAEASGEPHPITPSRLMRSIGSGGAKRPNSSERARRYLP